MGRLGDNIADGVKNLVSSIITHRTSSYENCILVRCMNFSKHFYMVFSECTTALELSFTAQNI